MPDAQELSPQGAIRREDMLGDLIGTMQRVHRRRRQRRRVVAGTHLLVLAAVVAVLVPSATRNVGGPIVEAPGIPNVATAASPVLNFEVVETDPAVVDRYTIAPKTRTIMLDDHRLLGALAAIDRPTGLVRRDGRLWLTSDVLAPR